jgi:hypothetical protein
MAKPKHKTFSRVLGSPLVVLPVVLGVGGAMVLWAIDKPFNIVAFLAILGASIGFGMTGTLMVFNPPRILPALVRKRQELVAGLEALADASWDSAAGESTALATAAALERA